MTSLGSGVRVGFLEEGASELNFEGCQSWPVKGRGKEYRQRMPQERSPEGKKFRKFRKPRIVLFGQSGNC